MTWIQSYLNHPVKKSFQNHNWSGETNGEDQENQRNFCQPPTEISPYPTPQSCTLARTFTENRSRAKSIFFQPPSPSALGVAGLSLSVDQSTELFEIDGTILPRVASKTDCLAYGCVWKWGIRWKTHFGGHLSREHDCHPLGFVLYFQTNPYSISMYITCFCNSWMDQTIHVYIYIRKKTGINWWFAMICHCQVFYWRVSQWPVL